MKHNEKLSLQEHARKHTTQDRRERESLSVTVVERLVQQQADRFAGIERYLTVRRREAIRAKLERERQQLLRMIETEKRIQAAQVTTALILNKAFFRHKTIDTSLLE